MRIQCVIIEDLKVASDYLLKCCTKHGELEVKGQFADVASALEFLNKNTVDLLFLDVEMPGATGFELLDNIAYKPRVILTTSKEKYAYNAFQYHVADFLKKPFTYARFCESIERLKELQPASTPAPSANNGYVYIKTEGKLVKLSNDDILYIESMGDYVRFVTRDKKYVTHNSMSNLEDKIDKDCFMRVHRSFIINVQKIDDIRENEVRINGAEIPVSKNLKAEVLRKITIL